MEFLKCYFVLVFLPVLYILLCYYDSLFVNAYKSKKCAAHVDNMVAFGLVINQQEASM